ncbi:hypothetical protein [Lacipirellula parvula]|uniref:hypothetical protein n=1 Tax=Lacipirellula parvula TaxID=2650471 RepID=UPI001260A18A|nr:hypothetical protein [Lacipirellula parvula]
MFDATKLIQRQARLSKDWGDDRQQLAILMRDFREERAHPVKFGNQLICLHRCQLLEVVI